MRSKECTPAEFNRLAEGLAGLAFSEGAGLIRANLAAELADSKPEHRDMLLAGFDELVEGERRRREDAEYGLC